MSEPDNNAGFMGANAPAVKFENPGDTVTGIVQGIERRQQTEMSVGGRPGRKKTYEDGAPMWEWVWTLQTDEADSDDDDGLRRLFVRGKMVAAVRDAVKASKYRGLFVGNELTVTYTGLGPKKKGLNAPKLFTAVFRPLTDNSGATPDEYDREPGDEDPRSAD